MIVRLETVKQLLKYEDYEAAKQMLEKDLNDPTRESLYLLSLLYRYFDEYDQERVVVERALAEEGQNPYMKERLTWHNLPLFDRLVPRKPIEKGSYEHVAPIPEVIDNMCFVAGADSGYFPLLVECLESIRNTHNYKDVDICVLDCGLTDDEKHYLTTKLTVAQIKDPGWDVEIPAHLPQPGHAGCKAQMARCHLHKHFPQYKYIFFLDADIWVQDETALNIYLNFCHASGYALTANWGMDYVRDIGMGWQQAYMIPSKLTEVRDLPNVVSGAFLLNSEKKFCLDISNCHEKILTEFGWVHCADEVALFDAMKIHNVVSHDQLVPRDVHVTSNVMFIKDNIFHSGRFQKPIGLIHIVDNKKDFFRSVFNADTNGHQPVSVHYRNWPWQDKEQLKILMGE